MKLRLLTFLLIFNTLAIHGETISPYSGEELRSIKSLSQDKIAALLDGQGLGYAKVAELNGYPGPAHVLELAEQLQLTEKQLSKSKGIFNAMKEQARKLGAELIESERALNTLFESGEITEEIVLTTLADISAIEGKLKAVHINAHLQQKAVLTQHQIHMYNALRGYHAGGHHSGHQQH